MGNQSNSSYSGQMIRKQEWVQASQDDHGYIFSGVNPYSKGLLINKATAQLVQFYELHFLNQQDLNTCLHHYQSRFSLPSNQYHQHSLASSPHIYPVRCFRNLSHKGLCAQNYTGVLYVDKVELKLRQVNDIPFSDQVYLYKACLQGFKLLQEKYGFFEISQDMIFITKQGKVKVWIHPNLAKIQPNLEPQYCFQSSANRMSQTQMVHRLITIIETNTYFGPVQISYRHFLKQRHLFDRLSFSKAVDYFQTFVDEYKIDVGNFMYSIYQLFHHEEQIHFWQESLVYALDIFESKINHQQKNFYHRRQQSKPISDTNSTNSLETLSAAKVFSQTHQPEKASLLKIGSISNIENLGKKNKIEPLRQQSSQRQKTIINSISNQKKIQQKNQEIHFRALKSKQRHQEQTTIANLRYRKFCQQSSKLYSYSTLPDSPLVLNQQLQQYKQQSKKNKKTKEIKVDEYILDIELAADMIKYFKIDPLNI